VSDVAGAFREFFRVLRPGGRVVVLEISQPTSPVGRRVTKWYLGRLLPRMTRLATRSDDAELMMRYYWETIASCVPPATILNAMRDAGFDEVHRTVYFGICSEYYGTKR
jgi:demethylmenaquinone methyltransferase/2-methoxy-6-polyprenyl-1,4-benzoquinol methylase